MQEDYQLKLKQIKRVKINKEQFAWNLTFGGTTAKFEIIVMNLDEVPELVPGCHIDVNLSTEKAIAEAEEKALKKERTLDECIHSQTFKLPNVPTEELK